jgi:Na+/H+-dicarboxylate symporter
VLASFDIPAAGVALLIAVDAIPDLFATTANVTGDFAAVSIVRRFAARGEAAQTITEPLHPGI